MNTALPLLPQIDMQQARQDYETALRSKYQDDSVLAHGRAVWEALTQLPRPTGAHDLQLPAIAKLPGLVAVLAADGITDGAAFDTPVRSAIATTSDRPTALDYGQICARMMAAAADTGSTQDAIAAGLQGASPQAAALLDEALERRAQPNDEVTRHFGMACDLPFGVPSALHNIATATSFEQAVKRNIWAGGDSCGRAILVGAVMGAVHGIGGTQGIPEAWLARLDHRTQTDALLAQLFDA